MEAIGQRIRAVRKLRHLTQVQLAEAVGIDQSTLSDIERGAGFGADVLMRFAEALSSSPHYIMRGGTEKQMLEDELVANFRVLEPGDQDALAKHARSLAATSKPSATQPFKYQQKMPAAKVPAKKRSA